MSLGYANELRSQCPGLQRAVSDRRLAGAVVGSWRNDRSSIKGLARLRSSLLFPHGGCDPSRSQISIEQHPKAQGRGDAADAGTCVIFLEPTQRVDHHESHADADDSQCDARQANECCSPVLVVIIRHEILLCERQSSVGWVERSATHLSSSSFASRFRHVRGRTRCHGYNRATALAAKVGCAALHPPYSV